MKTVHKFWIHHTFQTATVYVKADSPSVAKAFLMAEYPWSEVEYIEQVDFQHAFDFEV